MPKSILNKLSSSSGTNGASAQQLSSTRALGQGNRADRNDVAGSPSKSKRRDPQGQKNKKRKKRTLNDLVRVCEGFGDTSDKSELLARWNSCRKKESGFQSRPTNIRLRKMIHDFVLKLEQLSKDLKAQGGASGKVRDVARERYWEADSPLTSLGKFETSQHRHCWSLCLFVFAENPLGEDVLASRWTPLQVESWALYLKSQILFAGLGVRFCLCIEYDYDSDSDSDSEASDKIMVAFLAQAFNKLDNDSDNHEDSISDISDSDSIDRTAMESLFRNLSDDFYDTTDSTSVYNDSDDSRSAELDDDDDIRWIGYKLSPDVKIPVARFASRMCIELKRLSQVQFGNARAFQLALMLRWDVLGMTKFPWVVPVGELRVFLMNQLINERDDTYPSQPFVCVRAFLYLNSFIRIETHSKTSDRRTSDIYINFVVQYSRSHRHL